MKEISDLKEEYNSLEEENSLAIIDFFESNSNYLLSNGIRELSEIEYIYIDYFASLFKKSRYSKILEVINLLEQSDEFMQYRKIDSEFDEDIRFYKYASLFFKRKYSDSKKGFIELVKDFPENENYPHWLFDSKKKIRHRILSLMLALTVGFMFLTLVAKMYWHFPVLVPIGHIAESLFVITFILYYANYIIKKRD